MLSSLYRYGQLAYVGGGFGKGIHNILEAAVYGIPVIFGPNFGKSREARELTESGGAFTVNSQHALNEIFDRLFTNPGERSQAAVQAKNYINANIGATARIVQHVLQNQSLRQ